MEDEQTVEKYLPKTLILGGTGTLGQALLKYIFKTYKNPSVTVLSRSEHKQKELQKIYPSFKFVLGDIRDKSSIGPHFKGHPIVIHAAALKHIDLLEHNPIESVKTNVLGTINAAECAISNMASHFIFCSTDKAVDPINVYGNCKAISERVLFNYNELGLGTEFKVFRWGNVVGSQGSVIPIIVSSVLNNTPIKITDPSMTRFWINVDKAVEFIFSNYTKRESLFIPDMKSSSLMSIVRAIESILSKKAKIEIVGVRPGEKLHESLRTQHSREHISSKDAKMFVKKDLIDLLKPEVEALCKL